MQGRWGRSGHFFSPDVANSMEIYDPLLCKHRCDKSSVTVKTSLFWDLHIEQPHCTRRMSPENNSLAGRTKDSWGKWKSHSLSYYKGRLNTEPHPTAGPAQEWGWCHRARSPGHTAQATLAPQTGWTGEGRGPFTAETVRSGLKTTLKRLMTVTAE